MRSGRMKSSTAAPSFRNSGFETTANAMLDAARRELFGDRAAHAVGRAHRHRRLVDDDLVLRHAPADVARGGEHVLHVGRAVLVRRRADGDELQRAVRDGGVDVGREVQAAGGDVALRSSARGPARGSARRRRSASSIFARVDVEAQHVVADLGEAGAGDEADVAGADHRDLHAVTPSDALMAASAATRIGAPA